MTHDALCSADNSQLVVVDLQIRLLAAMSEIDRATLVKNAEIILQAASALEIPVSYTEQYPKGLGPTVPAIMENMPEGAEAIEKTCFSCCDVDAFRQSLEKTGRRQVVLIGQEAHICILQTSLELAAMGFRVFVVEDAVCSRFEVHKRNALMRMRHAGVVVTNLESVLFEWVRDATHPQFKLVSTLVR